MTVPRLTLDLCQSLTRLTRQMLESDRQRTETHVLGKGHVYRVTVEITPVHPDRIEEAIKSCQ